MQIYIKLSNHIKRKVNMEEREIVKGFGKEYEEYRHKVPKFFPRFQNQGKTI